MANNLTTLSVKSISDQQLPDLADWMSGNTDGQLSIDVYQDQQNLYVKSTIAGVRSEDLDITIHNDMLTIRGNREQQAEIREDEYFCRECYWGNFSRSIILPLDVKTDEVTASLDNGVLLISLPKSNRSRTVPVLQKPSA